MTTELKLPRRWTLDDARDFAIKAHGDQMYGDRPYVAHLDEVVETLREFGFGDDRYLMAAGYLHDTVEDTGVRLSDITEEFGFPVAVLVDRVTDEPGKNRREKKKATYPKIVQSERAVILKLADRISNVRSVIREGKTDLLAMYRNEHLDFVGNLYRMDHEQAKPMWKALCALFDLSRK